MGNKRKRKEKKEINDKKDITWIKIFSKRLFKKWRVLIQTDNWKIDINNIWITILTPSLPRYVEIETWFIIRFT